MSRFRGYRAKRELKAFAKVSLEPGEEKQIFFTLEERSFAIWENGWKIPKGAYDICIGKDSHTMILRKEMEISKEAGKSIFIADEIAVKELPHVHRQTDNAGLFSNDTENIVTYPPACIGGKFVTELKVETLQRAHQSQIALLNKIVEGDSFVAVFLGDADHKA